MRRDYVHDVVVSNDSSCEGVSWKGNYGDMHFIIHWGICFPQSYKDKAEFFFFFALNIALLDLTAGRKASDLNTGCSVVRNRHGNAAAAHLDRNDGHVSVSERSAVLYILSAGHQGDLCPANSTAFLQYAVYISILNLYYINIYTCNTTPVYLRF